ncbi:MAG: kelch repeat-containing protein [Myxococcota bacterium]
MLSGSAPPTLGPEVAVRRIILALVVAGCAGTPDTQGTECEYEGTVVAVGDSVEECPGKSCVCTESGIVCPDLECDEDTGDEIEPYEGPWEVLTSLEGAGPWPAVGVLGDTLHVLPARQSVHHTYDFAEEVWDEAAALPDRAYYQGGNAVDGEFYVFGGGWPTTLDSLDTVRSWSSETDTWTDRAPLPTPRGYVTSAVVGGELFAIGGPNISGQTFNRTVEIYTPATDSWRAGSLMPTGTMWPLYSAIAAQGDRIYLLGGGISNNPFNTAVAYDIPTDTWVSLTSAPVPVHGPTGAVLDGKMYVMGGYLSDGITDRTWVYDIDGDSWSEGPALPYAMAYSKAVVVENCVYLVGGFDDRNPEPAAGFLRWCPE